MRKAVILIFCATFLWSCTGKNDEPRSSSSRQTTAVHLTVGEEGVLRMAYDGPIPVCATKAVYDRFTTFTVANDLIGIQQLITTDNIWMIERGTHVLVIDMGWTGWLEVRLLDGSRAGYSGFVDYESVWSHTEEPVFQDPSDFTIDIPATRASRPLKCKIVEKRDVSHAAAGRVTYWVRIADDYSKEEIRQVITNVTSKHKSDYDIIWLKIVPPDGKPNAEGFWGWGPVICGTKWISPSLDEEWHTKHDAMGIIDEHYKGIAIAWHDEKPPETKLKKELQWLRSSQVLVDLGFKEWKRMDLGDGTERWLAKASNLTCELTPNYIGILEITTAGKMGAECRQAIEVINRLIFPDNYKTVNNTILDSLIQLSAFHLDQKQMIIYGRFHLELSNKPTFENIYYEVSER